MYAYAVIYFLTLPMAAIGSGLGVLAIIFHLRREPGQDSDEALMEDMLLAIVWLAGAIYLLCLAHTVI